MGAEGKIFIFWFSRAQESTFSGAFLSFAMVYPKGTTFCGTKDATEQVVTFFQKQKGLFAKGFSFFSRKVGWSYLLGYACPVSTEYTSGKRLLQ